MHDLKEFRKVLEGDCFDVEQLNIPGWLMKEEGRALHALAGWSRGPILEIGAWVGLSTIAMALAIREHSKRFVTAEIGPTGRNFRPYGDGIGFFLPETETVPSGVCPVSLYEEDMKPLVEGRGLIALLKENLHRAGVSDLVEIHHGDFRTVPLLSYSFIFSDTSHDEAEARKNTADVGRLAQPGAVLAFHDTSSSNERVIREYLSFSESMQVESLFIGVLAPGGA